MHGMRAPRVVKERCAKTPSLTLPLRRGGDPSLHLAGRGELFRAALRGSIFPPEEAGVCRGSGAAYLVRYEDAEEGRPAPKDLRHMRQAVYVAQEVGEGVGRGALLLGPVSRPASIR